LDSGLPAELLACCSRADHLVTPGVRIIEALQEAPALQPIHYGDDPAWRQAQGRIESFEIIMIDIYN